MARRGGRHASASALTSAGRLFGCLAAQRQYHFAGKAAKFLLDLVKLVKQRYLSGQRGLELAAALIGGYLGAVDALLLVMLRPCLRSAGRDHRLDYVGKDRPRPP